MSTPDQEYEEAVEIVAKWLQAAAQCGLWETCSENVKRLRRNEARSILSLTWPSGQPMIGVLSKAQGFRALTALMPPERKIGFDLAVGEMKEAGFQRVLLPEEKR